MKLQLQPIEQFLTQMKTQFGLAIDVLGGEHKEAMESIRKMDETELYTISINLEPTGHGTELIVFVDGLMFMNTVNRVEKKVRYKLFCDS